MGIKIDTKLCTGCGVCVNSCPCDVFRIEKNVKKAVTKYPEDCMLCWLCLNDCPTKAIKIIPENKSLLTLSWG
jgi:NAD-dependent dihydropyrimidine dehydrogenase PreA subunit